ncbi:MAG: L,D-transpeptidase family protein [gamma proteobacterium symbiont of Bathyaustriella thionipta]|nr:L,D-transpeptidase family protein [gamma proteobacterium symbiont of Bathyaustriella thionipta]
MAADNCDRLKQLQPTPSQQISRGELSIESLLTDFYTQRNFQPVWDKRHIEELLQLISESYLDGLQPEDYHQQQLITSFAAFKAGRLNTCEQLDFDQLLSDALVRLAYHYRFGKVNPERLDPNWNIPRKLLGNTPVERLTQAVNADSLYAFLHNRIKTSHFYQQMKNALAKYREIEFRGGWQPVPAGPTLKPGMQDERVVALRARLILGGDLNDTAVTDPTLYDEAVEQAVERFQKRHTLDADGVAGKATLAQMNIPVAARIDQIRVNMERSRWIYKNLPDEFVVVNIAGFRVGLFKQEKLVWESRAQVGTPYRKTPIFQDKISYLEFNPTWTVPPGILRKDILPKMRKDPTYLKRKDMLVLKFDGSPVNPDSIDWNSSHKSFPYMIRQQPGPRNALGRVKFMFPNKYLVYLHDTPSKSNFNRSSRAFSSGCIRVERPFELAELLLNDPYKWSQQDMQKVLDSRKTTRASLKQPMPVFLLYWTVYADGELFYFKPDIYKRDAAVLEALNSDPRFELPHNTTDENKT